MATARKVSFQEAWDSATVFYVDEELEDEIDQDVEKLLALADDEVVSGTDKVSTEALAAFLTKDPLALDVILREIELSQEKFMRVISLMRKLGRIEGGFEREWSFRKITGRVTQDMDFSLMVARTLMEGKRDKELAAYIPRYYLETLNYGEIRGGSLEGRRIRYKSSLIGTYSGRKGHKVEGLIKQRLEVLGVPYEKGRSRMTETDMDFAIPSLADPWIVIMSLKTLEKSKTVTHTPRIHGDRRAKPLYMEEKYGSKKISRVFSMSTFQETTSSGQSVKTRDMLAVFERVNRVNNRYGENRAFVNFVDGGGWLARKRDMERLVENCHYFVNLNLLGLLEGVVQKHYPSNKR